MSFSASSSPVRSSSREGSSWIRRCSAVASVEAAERKQLARELVAGERELSVGDQPPPCDRGQRRTTLLSGCLDVAALENQPRQAEPATGLGELALGGRGEAIVLDIAARAPKDTIVVQYAAKAQRPLDIIIAGAQSLPERFCAGRVHVDVFPDTAEFGAPTDDHEIEIARSTFADRGRSSR